MSFQNQGFWMGKGTGCLNDGEMAYDSSSRIEPKRSHQWFMDGPDAELFPNKKQAVEVPNNSLFSGMLSSNVSPWGNTSGFHSISGNFTERLFDSEAARAVHFDDRSISSVTNEKMNVGRKDSEDLFGNESSFGLSMSHTLEDPRSGLSYGGIRKVKVSQVKDSENVMSVSMGHAYNRGDNDTLSASHAYNKADENCISMGLTYNKGEESIISMGVTYDRDDNNFISMGQSYNKGEDSISMGQPFKENNDTLLMGHAFGKGDNTTISMSQTFNKADESPLAMGHIYSKGEESTLAMGHVYSKGDENTLAMGHVYSKGDESTISMGQLYKGDESAITMGHIYNKREEGAISMGHMYNKGDESTISMRRSYNKSDNNLSMGHSYSKGDSSTIISFGGYDDDDANPSGRLICNYDLLMSQSSVQRTETMSEKELVKSNADLLANNAQIIVSGSDNISKKKEEVKPSKKVPPNNFPSNVRSLLSTGMLDGVSVKYTAWSREKELRGVIKGSGYLCGCQSCNLTKVINAYEFERHAGCKTKHPNNHIYFENGKTIYGIVQELRSTPQNMLFEVIQTITGSPINQKSFRLWKESFLAATRELQRIYGKDEGKQFS